MNQQEKKEYIKKNWKASSGKKLAEMLNRYWKKPKEKNGESVVELTKKVFNIKEESE